MHYWLGSRHQVPWRLPNGKDCPYARRHGLCHYGQRGSHAQRGWEGVRLHVCSSWRVPLASHSMALGALLSPCVGWRVSWVSAAAVWALAAGCWVPACCVFCGRGGCSLVRGSLLSCVAGRVSLLLAPVGCLVAAACVASPALRSSFWFWGALPRCRLLLWWLSRSVGGGLLLWCLGAPLGALPRYCLWWLLWWSVSVGVSLLLRCLGALTRSCWLRCCLWWL